jgi:putative DNA primase/helicase
MVEAGDVMTAVDRSDEMLEMYAADAGGAEVRPLYPPPTAPLEVARKLYAKHRQLGGRTLVCWRAGWMRWHGPHWSEMDTAELRSGIYDALGEVDYKHPIREKGRVVDYEVRPWSPDKHKVANVIEAMAAIGHLPTEIDPPSWIDSIHSAAKTQAARMISCDTVQRGVGAVPLRP